MNQLEIEEYLDKLAQQTEKDIDRVFNARLRTLLIQLAEMYDKYSDGNGELSWTDINRYNRLNKELERMNSMLNDAYKEIIRVIQKSNESIYLEGYMRHMYLYENFTQQPMHTTIPSVELIQQVIANPIPKLTLPKIFEPHRNELIRRINIEISQGIMNGDGYATIARKLRKTTGFSQHKARTVVRTETGRVRSIANNKSEEKASKYAELTGVWLSALDFKVRHSHRELDGKETDKNGYFRYRGLKAKGPHLWGVPSMDINCRCVKITKVNGMLPEIRRGRDYTNPEYQQKLANRIESYTKDGLTYKQAYKQARKEIQPPSVTFPFKTYEEWLKEHS